MFLEIKLMCNECGKILQGSADYTNVGLNILVEPCETCGDDKFQAGFESGCDEGIIDESMGGK